MAQREGEGLSVDERAELEQLRAERARRERESQRAELERLRGEQERAEREAALDARDARRREQAAKIMEPDEDLSMPFAQKLVLALVAVVMVAAVFYIISGASGL